MLRAAFAVAAAMGVAVAATNKAKTPKPLGFGVAFIYEYLCY